MSYLDDLNPAQHANYFALGLDALDTEPSAGEALAAVIAHTDSDLDRLDAIRVTAAAHYDFAVARLAIEAHIIGTALRGTLADLAARLGG